MKPKNIILIALCLCAPVFAAGAATKSKCSLANLNRCMDSVCAINSGVNPSARCQYCGTSNAGTPPTQKGLTNVTAGQSTKYAISARDLESAPSDPEKRYNWATNECIKKLPDCTAQDVSESYDKLIEQSCRAAGVTAQIARTSAEIKQKPTKQKCTTSLTTCTNKKCGTDFASCATDVELDRAVAECAVDATGCDEYIAEFRENMRTTRNSLNDAREDALRAIVTKHQDARTGEVETALQKCKNNSASDTCVKQTCTKLTGKCEGTDAETETAMAKQFCKFYDTACTVLK